MAKVKVLQKERSMWVAKNVEWLQVWLLTLLLYDLDAHFCSFILKVSFFLHQCTLRSPAFFWWFRPRLAYWTYMSMISNYICYGPYYKCNLLLIAYTQTIPDSKSKSKSLNPRTYIKSDPRKLCSQVIFLNSRQFQFHVHSPYNNMYVPKLNCRFIYAL